MADTESIDGLDSTKTKYNEEPIQPDIKVEQKDNTNFRDILNNQVQTQTNNDFLDKQATEQKRRNFWTSYGKIEKMQDVVKMARGQTTEKIEEQEGNITNVIEEPKETAINMPEEETQIDNIELSQINNTENQVQKDEFADKSKNNILENKINTSDEDFLKMYERILE